MNDPTVPHPYQPADFRNPSSGGCVCGVAWRDHDAVPAAVPGRDTGAGTRFPHQGGCCCFHEPGQEHASWCELVDTGPVPANDTDESAGTW